jgi:dihydrofolate reductase
MWHLPDDFKWFIQKTKGKAVIMGRNTMISLEKPLKNRLNIVLSSRTEDIFEGFTHVFTWDDALKLAEEFNSEEAMVIGGGVVYSQAIGFSDVLYLTKVNAPFPESDTFFPEFDLQKWKLIELIHHPADELHVYDFNFEIFENTEK